MLDLISAFDGYAETVIGFYACIDQLLQKKICEGEIVVGRIVFVRIEIPEYIGYIHI